MQKKMIKNEKGSITLFVLLAILFFLIVIFSLFMTSSNKNRIQMSELDKMKQEYQESVDNINQIYQETLTENLSNMLKIGDYVNYTYDTVSSGYSLPSAESGYDTNQTIAQTTGLKWRILNIYKDGTVDLVSENPTNQEVYFKVALGYNNGVLLLNDICAKQYSNKSLGITARSINIEDIESQMNEEGIAARNAYTSSANIQYGKTKTYGNGANQYPTLYAKENKSGINSTTTKTDGISSSDNGYTYAITETSNTAVNGLTVTQTYYFLNNVPDTYFDNSTIYQLIFSTNTNYWLASRFVDSYSNSATFGLRTIYNFDIGGYYNFDSDGHNGENNSRKLRPVLSLDITQIQPCTGTADGTDTTIAHMHQIRQ